MLNYFLTKDFFFSFHTNKSPFLLYEEIIFHFTPRKPPKKKNQMKVEANV